MKLRTSIERALVTTALGCALSCAPAIAGCFADVTPLETLQCTSDATCPEGTSCGVGGYCVPAGSSNNGPNNMADVGNNNPDDVGMNNSSGDTGGNNTPEDTEENNNPADTSGNNNNNNNMMDVAPDVRGPVDCSAFIGKDNRDLCTSSDDACEVVFTDSAGCEATCAEAGLVCGQAFANDDVICAATEEALDCAVGTDHMSDYCVCVRPEDAPNNNNNNNVNNNMMDVGPDTPEDTGCTSPNACGGCEALSGEVGGSCGVCDQGTLACDGVDALMCNNANRGRNACDGCGGPSGDPGDGCGTCGALECNDADRLECVEGRTNACGGCGDLSNGLDDVCGECGLGRYVCDEDGTDVICEEPSPACLAWEVRVGGGTFTMGSPVDEAGRGEDPIELAHAVEITRDLMVVKYEISDSTYAILGSSPPSNAMCDGMDCPVDSATWFEAIDVANRLSTEFGLEACYRDPGDNTPYAGEDAAARKIPEWPRGVACTGFRLPTEAEWEYIARAGTNTALFNGDITGAACMDDSAAMVAWFCANANNQTHGVGMLQANDFGVYDVHGNVSEWVWDRYDGGYYADADAPMQDPAGPTAGVDRVVRGGNYSSQVHILRSAARDHRLPEDTSDTIGFRLVRSLN